MHLIGNVSNDLGMQHPFWFGWEEMADVVGNVDELNFSMVEEVSTEFANFDQKLSSQVFV